MAKKRKNNIDDNLLWYKDAVIYQLHVRSFSDSNGDGIGDFNGLTSKLDYLESLGITAVWLLPFYPSPLRDDGYDIADYFNVHPTYGTLKDFKNFLRQAHKRGIRVITELVLNHTSDQHAWFVRSRKAPPGSAWRNFYVWSNTTEKYKDARIIFKDFENSNWSWDPVAQSYYWHRFYHHQPDLNFESSTVQKALLRVIDFWMDMGVDGMRLDAVPYLYEEEGTDCENLPQTYEFLRKLRTHVEERFPGRMLLAEANQWPEDAAAYFGNGDICHMAFHFPLMPRIFMALQMEDWFPIVDILEQTPDIPYNSQWAIFLRNHDELTLEMVTDEERDYMYRFYAHDENSRINLGIRRRLAPLLRNSRRRIEIMNILLLSLPGTPIIYYGDEIGMGDNHYLGDRNGVRTPMQWSADRNAGFSPTNPQQLFLPAIIDPEYHYETINVETENRNVSSLLWWTRRVVAMRRKYRAFSRGDIEFIRSDNPNVFTFIRHYEDEAILVVVNLSRFSQSVTLDMREYAGYTPMDIFSSNRFPTIKDHPYVLTMGFHDYFWLVLRPETDEQQIRLNFEPPEVTITKQWDEIFSGRRRHELETTILPGYLDRRTSAGTLSLPVRDVKVADIVRLRSPDFSALLLVLRIRYTSGASNTILLPVSAASPDIVSRIVEDNSSLILARIKGPSEQLLFDCAIHPSFHRLLFKVLRGRKALKGTHGSLHGTIDKALRRTSDFPFDRIEVLETNSRNSSFSYGTDAFCKLYRNMEEGTHPEVEMLSYLTNQPQTSHRVPNYYGSLAYKGTGAPQTVIAVFTEYIEHTGTSWELAVSGAAKFLEEVLSQRAELPALSLEYSLLDLNSDLAPSFVRTFSGLFATTVSHIGDLTASMHKALGKASDGDAFRPEAFSMLYQRSLYQALQSQAKIVFGRLRKRAKSFNEAQTLLAEAMLDREREIMSCFGFLVRAKLSHWKMRIHGDYGLDQILNLGTGLAVKDFEGNALAALSERRLKRSPIRDVAALIYSIHSAALTGLYRKVRVNRKDLDFLEPWADAWATYMSNLFLSQYFSSCQGTSIVPESPEEIGHLLRLFLLERALGELKIAATERPGDLVFPARALETFLTRLNIGNSFSSEG